MRIKVLDIIAILISICIIIFSLALTHQKQSTKLLVFISSGDKEWIFPVKTNKTIEIPGPIGNTIIEISNKGVKIKDSPCPNKLCIKEGIIKNQGQYIACLPNKIIVKIQGSEEGEETDAGSY